jgi:hypothetical protein
MARRASTYQNPRTPSRPIEKRKGELKIPIISIILVKFAIANFK